MLRLTAVFAAALLVLLTVPGAAAQECQVGTGLASSLLIPYFEVDLTNPAGTTTLFSINNEHGNPTLTRVVFWSDWGVPTLSFDVYLNRFDVQTFNVRDQFNGNVPSTGETEDLSTFNFCGTEDFKPSHANPALDASEVAQFRADHTGVSGPNFAGCAGHPHGDQVARGYITVDVVDECSGIQDDGLFTPAWGGYFNEGGGGAGAIGIVANRLWGDFQVVTPDDAFAQGSEAVGLWADPAQFGTDPTFTFYGRFHGYDGRDERVPLPTWWATRFLNGGAFSGGTDLIVWRDPGVADAGRIACGTTPSWYPLDESFITARDETASDASSFPVGAGSEVFPLATQRVSTTTFGIPYAFGRMQMALGDGPALNNPRQAWVQTVLSANGLYSVGANARALAGLCGEAP